MTQTIASNLDLCWMSGEAVANRFFCLNSSVPGYKARYIFMARYGVPYNSRRLTVSRKKGSRYFVLLFPGSIFTNILLASANSLFRCSPAHVGETFKCNFSVRNLKLMQYLSIFRGRSPLLNSCFHS